MTKLSSVQARENFADLVNRVAYTKETTVITKNGKAAVAVIPAEYLSAFEDSIDLKLAKKGIKEAKKKGVSSWKKIKADLKLG